MNDNKPEKESFAAYVTRITGFAAAISLGGLFLGLPESLEPWAKEVTRYSVVTWGALVGLPAVIKLIWKNQSQLKRGIQGIRSKGELVVQSVGEAVSTLTTTEGEKQSSISQVTMDLPDQVPVMRYTELPEPLNFLPVNPIPIPRGALTAETAAGFVRNTIQMAGLNMDEDPEILKINSGPTLQSITFQLPRGLQLSTLVKRRDDLANHTGLTQGFSVEPGDVASSATFVIPQAHRAFVYMRDIAPSFIQFSQSAKLPVIFGKDTKGEPIVRDLVKLPHLLVAGTTGSGKSVFVNTLLESLISVRSPDKLKLLLIDPKMVEFNVYNGMPHLMAPTVTEPKRASMALLQICVEMDKRYDELSSVGARNIEQYNKAYPNKAVPYIVVAIDEYADLMMVAGGDVEDAVIRIAQKARACGIHLILGTQRPSADVVTGIIKANLPSRVVFQLQSSHDYRTILEGGHRSLLGKGDGLCRLEDGRLIRFQSAAISGEDEEMIEYIQETKKYWMGRLKAVSSTPQPIAVDWENIKISKDNMPGESIKIEDHRMNELFDVNDGQVSLITNEEENSDENKEQVDKYDTAEHEESGLNSWSETFDILEEDDDNTYNRFVSVIQRCGGFSMSIVNEHLRMELSQAGKYVERMREENLLGSYDDALKMHPWIGDREQSGDSSEDILLDTIKEYICRFRSTRTMEIRDYLNIRKEKVLQMMKLLAEEGFLDLPTSPKSGYTIAWDDEQIRLYLEQKDGM